jgi:hypothetical protein
VHVLKNHPRHLSTWLRPVDALVLVYQALVGLIVLLGDAPVDRLQWLSVHLVGSALVLWFCWATRDRTRGFANFLREWYPLIVMTFLYKEVGPLVHALFPGSLDAALARVDETVFLGGGPALWRWQQAVPPPRWLNEFFHVGYGFYFFLMPIGGVALWLYASRERFRTYMFALCLTYYAHYLLFILLPAHSPRFFLASEGLREPLPGYLVSDFVRLLVEGNAYPGGSFPSSHVAAAVQVFMAYQVLGRLRLPIVAVTLTLFAGTVWGRYHYVSDLAAGFLAGCFFLWVSPRVELWVRGWIARLDPGRGRGHGR